MFKYNLINTDNLEFNIDKKILDEIFNNINNTVDKDQNGMLNIIFLSPVEVQNLNKDYRNIDKTTDVLSFHYFDDFSNLEADIIVGEIILNQEKIIKQGQEYQLGSEKEFYKLVIHSVLHILGYDHEENSDYEIMKKFEEKIWELIFEK
ncbi:MAG: rRNA maturation RNase YbeY [Candidatus Gracilibacteria bacterium]|nr:rRNA maturation RNase YbeY [Candidatus Gracilibacteria bacterium]